MKIVFSRKGFDSDAGGYASPILDDVLVSLPIPDAESKVKYKDVICDPVGSLGDIVHDLTRGRISHNSGAHLDPDLDRGAAARAEGWRPIFGQVDQAQSHLLKQGVGVGDLFLMFGWFRRAEKRNGRVSFVQGAQDLQVLYGWFQVGSVLQLGSTPDRQQFPKWAHYHPHFFGQRGRNNVLYVAADDLTLKGAKTGLAGAGRFRLYHPELQLTAADSPKRSVWKLPAWFDPTRTRNALSYHYNPARWQACDDGHYLQTVGRGQEFVFDSAVYPEAADWVTRLLHIA